MTVHPITDRQREIVALIENYTATHGYPPTIREIAETVGLRSTAPAHAHLVVLTRRGLLEWRDSGARCYWPRRAA